MKDAIMKAMNGEIKKVVSRVKTAQTKLKGVLKNQEWVEEARKYAERNGKEVKKLLAGDVTKVKTFLERERKELEKIQRQIPGEVKKVREYVQGQTKELEKLLSNIKKANTKLKKKAAASGNGSAKSSGGTSKKRSTKKSSS